jgi:hypothetical protein
MATNKGRELAFKLAPAIGTTRAITETCSLICRHATTHHRLQEQACNGYQTYDGSWDEAASNRADAREEKIEARIRSLVQDLPATDDGPFGVVFQGDPRGCTVKITAPGEWSSLYDDWGNEGVCVPV